MSKRKALDRVRQLPDVSVLQPGFDMSLEIIPISQKSVMMRHRYWNYELVIGQIDTFVISKSEKEKVVLTFKKMYPGIHVYEKESYFEKEG